jgi:hypothetical protein
MEVQMSKQYSTEQLNAMTLKQLVDLVNIPSLAKVSKAKAVERAMAALPEVVVAAPEVKAPKVAVAKVGGYKADSKFGKLYAALAVLRSRVELMEVSGFDNKNLSVALSIMKRAGHVVRTVVAEDKVARYEVVVQQAAQV